MPFTRNWTILYVLCVAFGNVPLARLQRKKITLITRFCNEYSRYCCTSTIAYYKRIYNTYDAINLFFMRYNILYLSVKNGVIKQQLHICISFAVDIRDCLSTWPRDIIQYQLRQFYYAPCAKRNRANFDVSTYDI